MWDSVAWTSYKFRIPQGMLPPVRLRPLCPDDLDVCHEIYRRNESDHFPPGFFERFCRRLTSEQVLFIVAEQEAKVVGFGGVTLHPVPGQYSVSLSFGMVHPNSQRQGIGTVLFLARLSALPTPGKAYTLTMSPIANSQTFYRKFGFGFIRSYRDTVSADRFDLFGLIIRAPDLQKCRDKLAASGVVLEIHRPVPVVGITKSEDGMYRVSED